MAKPKLAKFMFLAVHGTDTDDPFVVAHELEEDALEDDGPTLVGTYKLIGTKTFEKKVAEIIKRATKRS